MRHCRRCGGQINAHDTRCPWCGFTEFRAILSALALVGVVALGLAVLTQTPLWKPVARQLHLPAGEPFDPDFSSVSPGNTESAPSAAARSGAGQSGGTTRPQGPARRAGTSRNGWCGDSSRVTAGSGWDRATLQAISCGQVRAGFSVDQAAAALGRPGEVTRSADGASEEWRYGSLRIEIQNGRVVRVTR